MEEHTNHPVCQSCRGLCCEQFCINVVVDRETGLPDWHSQARRFKDVTPGDIDFIKEHFRPLRQPGDAVYEHFERPSEDGGAAMLCHSLWFTCTAFKDGRCTEYEKRPNVCRIHLCNPAKRRKVNPELDIVRDGEGFKYRDVFPAMSGPGDPVFVKPGYDCQKRFELNAERDRRLKAELPERYKVAAARAGITDTLDQHVAKLEEADRCAAKEPDAWLAQVVADLESKVTKDAE